MAKETDVLSGHESSVQNIVPTLEINVTWGFLEMSYFRKRPLREVGM